MALELPINVSVVIPVHNGQKYLAQALESVLNQTVPPREIIVVDDESTDDSAKIASTYGAQVRYIKQSRAGASTARNRGVDESSGNYLAFLDADDFWLPTKIERQLPLIVDSVKTMVFCQLENFISPELKLILPADKTSMPGYSSCTMLVSKADFLDIGYFSVELTVGEFIEWFSRARERGMVTRMVDEALVKRRIHDNEQTADRAKLAGFAQLAKILIDRKREAVKQPEK